MSLRPLTLTLSLALCTSAHAAEDFIYTVQVGDHPWNIAQRYLRDTSDALRLTRLNHIVNDRTLAPGTRLQIPAQWLRLEAVQVQLLAVRGDALVVRADGSGRAALAGERLVAGERLRTGERSSVMLAFDDGSRVLVRQSSELQLQQSQRRAIDGGPLVQLELVYGALENIVTPRTRHDTRFEIRTPAAVAAVRGTRFRVNASAQATWTEVLEGAVQVSNPDGAVQAAGGFGAITQRGQAPMAAQVLPPAPDLSGVAQRMERLPIDWPLEPVVGATGYRTQLAAGADFVSIWSDEMSSAPRVRVQDIEDGTYVMRVRAIGRDGLEGLASERTITVHARPQAPALITPAPDAQTTEVRPVFRWTEIDPSWRYRIELRRGAATDTPAVHVQSAESGAGTAAAIDLEPGIWFWRVASIVPATGRQGPWGDPQAFRRVLASPGSPSVDLGAGGVTIRWPTLPHAQGYDVELASAAGFATPLRKLRVDAAQQQWNDLAPGAYQIRLRSIGPDGVAGPWGLAQHFVVPAPAPPPPPANWNPLLLLLLPALLLLGL